MKRPWIHVELGRHTCLYETLRVLDILVYKQIECADRNVRRRQVRQIGSPRRRRIGRHVVPTTIPAQVGFPTQAVALTMPHARVGNRIAGRGDVTVIDHGVD